MLLVQLKAPLNLAATSRRLGDYGLNGRLWCTDRTKCSAFPTQGAVIQHTGTKSVVYFTTDRIHMSALGALIVVLGDFALHAVDIVTMATRCICAQYVHDFTPMMAMKLTFALTP